MFTGQKIEGFFYRIKAKYSVYYFFDLFFCDFANKNYAKLTSEMKNYFSDTIWVFKKAEICISLKHGMHNRMQNRIEFYSF
jgi:hypothetical protein